MTFLAVHLESIGWNDMDFDTDTVWMIPRGQITWTGNRLHLGPEADQMFHLSSVIFQYLLNLDRSW